MISHQHKCIFIHIPKCAGTSVERAFGHFDGFAGRGGQDHRSLRMIENPVNILQVFSSAQNMKEAYRRYRYGYRTNYNTNNSLTLTRDQYKEYYKFTIVRNPWARAFSWYHNVMRDTVHRQNHGITDDLTLSEFLKRYAGKGMLRTQLYWIKGFDGGIQLDKIIRFENLEDEYRAVAEALNISDIELPYSNMGRTQHYQKYYDDDAVQRVMHTYKEEIDLFGYSFDD